MAAVSQKSSKKRSATSQAGPASKKPHVDEHLKSTKKRSRPVTSSSRKDSSDSEAEYDGEDGIDLADEGDEDDWVDEDETMEVDEAQSKKLAPISAKDPAAAREAHKVQKALHEQRKAAKPHSTLLTDAKQVWSQARQKNIPAAERQKHVRELMDVIRGKVKDIVFKHDASRIVQTAVKYGQAADRNEIAAELKGKYKELAQNKYSKFLVTKLIRFCPTRRSSILLEFQSHVLKLLLHREASSVLADAFELYANAYERSILLREFYGKEVALFSSSADVDKEQAKKGLVGIIDGIDKERRKRILAALKENLDSIFNNPDKGAVTHAIVHRALWEYLAAINSMEDETEREKLRRDVFENCQEVLAEMVHTKDGSRVVREFLARGNAKDRKQILKVLKPHIARMCTDDEAQMVLFTAIDVVDDTKLVQKNIVAEMTNSASDLLTTPQGRRALFYLFVPRTRRHFTPAQIASLAETDEARTATSKKAADVREAEIRTGASEALLTWIAEKGDAISREPGGSLVVTEIMLHADGDKTSCIETLLRPISSPYPSPDSSSPHSIDLPHTSRMYKTLLQGGHFNHTSKTIQKAPSSSWNAGIFAAQFVDTVGEDVTVGMCLKGEKNGAFVVAELCAALVDGEGGNAELVKSARKKVKRWFSDAKKEIESGDGKGKKVLLDKLAAL